MSGMGWAAAAQAASSIGGQLIANSANRRGQYRQYKYQQDLMNQQYLNQRQLNSQGSDLQFDLWNKTNAAAQRKHLEDAGLNVGLMYGGSGAGGATTGSQGGGGAAGGSAQAAPQMTMDIGAAIMQAKQAELMAAQADKARAEAENLRGGVRGNLEQDVRGKTFDNDINELYRSQIEQARSWNWSRDIIKGEEENAVWEWKKAIEYGSEDGKHNYDNVNNRKSRAFIAEVNHVEEQLKNAKAEGDIKRAEGIIKEFEAELTKDGISPNSPWYAKLVTELLKKVGIVDFIKNEAKGK